jgi:hypothetical protein
VDCRQTFQVSCDEDGSWAGDQTCEPLRCSLSALRQLKSEFNTQILPDNTTLIHLPSPGGVGWGAQDYKAYQTHISVVFGSAVRLRCAQDYDRSNAGSVEPVCAVGQFASPHRWQFVSPAVSCSLVYGMCFHIDRMYSHIDRICYDVGVRGPLPVCLAGHFVLSFCRHLSPMGHL